MSWLSTGLSKLGRTALLVASLTIVSPVYSLAVAAEDGISKQQAVSIATGARPGKVLSVRRSGSVYRVKTLNDKGEVRVVVIDAGTGKVISR